MDALSGFLDGPRASGAFLLRAVMEPPWSLRIEDRAPLSVVVVVTGEAYVVLDSGETTRLDPGDVALLRGPDPYVFADSPDTPPQVKILPGQECVSLSGVSVADAMGLGVRTWGNNPTGSTAMLVGSYESGGEISRRITDALPALAVLRARIVEQLDPARAPPRGRARPARSAGRPRPDARRPRDRRTARLVRPAGVGPAVLVLALRRTPSSDRPCGSSTTSRSTRGRSPASPARAGCPGPGWPGASAP